MRPWFESTTLQQWAKDTAVCSLQFRRCEVLLPLSLSRVALSAGPLFAFSTPNELFVGRMAQLGFAFALIGETVTGKGALAQLKFETGMSMPQPSAAA